MHRSIVFCIAAAVFAASFPNADAGAGPEPFRYLSPLPGARYVSPQSTLLFRPGALTDALPRDWTSSVRVSGSRSGLHGGSWTFSDDGKTVIFRPDRQFERGETVTVAANLVVDGFGAHIDKGYIYAAMGFAVFVEMLNIRRSSKRARPLKMRDPYGELGEPIAVTQEADDRLG